MRPGGQRCKVSRSGSRLPRLRAGRDDTWRIRIRQGVSRRALLAGIPDPAHRADQPAAHSQLYRREGAGLAEVVLRCEVNLPTMSFRGGAKRRTRNLEIPRCAIAHLRSGPSDHPGMTTFNVVREP